jgi:DNA-binding transcriptional LysR family regulator
LEDARKEVHEIAHERNTSLSIAISSPVVWLDALRSFISEYPDIKISHTLLKYDQFKNFSCCSAFDFLITAVSDLTDGHSRWEYDCLLSDDKPVICVYSSHPFAERKGLRLHETKDEKYIAVSRGFSMRKFFEDSCIMSGFTPKIVLECDYILRSSMFTAKHGIIFTTESGARANVLEDAVYIPVIDPPIRRMQVLFYKKSSYLSQTATLFREFMIAYYNRFSCSGSK